MVCRFASSHEVGPKPQPRLGPAHPSRRGGGGRPSIDRDAKFGPHQSISRPAAPPLESGSHEGSGGSGGVGSAATVIPKWPISGVWMHHKTAASSWSVEPSPMLTPQHGGRQLLCKLGRERVANGPLRSSPPSQQNEKHRETELRIRDTALHRKRPGRACCSLLELPCHEAWLSDLCLRSPKLSVILLLITDDYNSKHLHTSVPSRTHKLPRLNPHTQDLLPAIVVVPVIAHVLETGVVGHQRILRAHVQA